MKKLPLIALASSHRLLADIVCQPASIRLDRLAPLVQELQAGPSAARLAALAQLPAALASEEERWPWEEPLYTVERGVALVNFSGPMVKGYDAITCWFWGMASIDRLQTTMAELAARADVRAIVLAVDSPGGMCMGTPELGDSIKALASGKLVVSFTSGMMCSAAYWSGCAGSVVLATRSAMVGSIGTVWPIYDYSEAFAQMGIKVDVFKRGDYKGMGITGTALTAEQKRWADEQVGRINDGFTSFVREQRGAIAESTMQGQWFDGEQAVALGLADRVVSGLPEVLAEVQQQIAPSYLRP